MKVDGYTCDRCSKLVTEKNEVTTIKAFKEDGEFIKGYDLCKDCFRDLFRSIANGVEHTK